MAISRSNKETFIWLKRIKLKDITQENLVEEADYFFGAVKTKRRQTVQAKLVEFVEKEASLRKTLIFQIMRSRNGEGPRGRSPPLSFKPKDVTLVGFISLINGERESEFKCEICGTLLLGKDNCEKHLRSEHFKQFKSFLREVAEAGELVWLRVVKVTTLLPARERLCGCRQGSFYPRLIIYHAPSSSLVPHFPRLCPASVLPRGKFLETRPASKLSVGGAA